MKTHDTSLVIGIVIIAVAGISFAAFKFFYKNKTNSRKNPEVSIDIETTKQRVSKIINDYFKSLSEDSKNYAIAMFYSGQFSISELMTRYQRKIVRYSFDDFNFNAEEQELATQEIKNIVKEIININFIDKHSSLCLIFLLNYYEHQGKIDALDYLRTNFKAEEIDKERFDRLKIENEDFKKQLIHNFINS